MLPLDPGFSQGELLRQFGDHIHIARLVLPILGGVAVVIIIELVQQDNTSRLLIAKQRNGGIYPLLQVAETDDISKGFDGIEDAVGAAESLNEPVHLQVLVHPESVQGGGIKTGEEHIHHDQQIQFLVFHPQGNIPVVVLELVAVSGVVGVEHLIVVPDGCVHKVPAALVQGAGVLAVLLVQDAVRFLLVGPVAVNRGYP